MFLKLAIIQSNFHVGFLAANVARIKALYEIAAIAGADMAIFSEMTITGYPPQDLVLSNKFQELSMQAVNDLASITSQGPAMLIGGLWRENGLIYNTIFLLENGEVVYRQYKHQLPNYGVFDEQRVFASGTIPKPVTWRNIKLGLMICEDMWLPEVAASLKAGGAELLICINASPYEAGKVDLREKIAINHNNKTGLPLVYVNQVGGQDDLVFDGSSFAINASGKICLRMHAFKEDFGIMSWAKNNHAWHCNNGVIKPKLSNMESIYNAMMLGLKDFVNKNSYKGVVIGISGGIDSALSAAIAADALGGENVHLVMLPSHVTSPESIADAKECAKRLGTRFSIIPIDPGMHAFEEMIAPVFGDQCFEIIAANNQTRIRASILLAISVKEKSLLLTTGNKSEQATGFMTIYGDMCGHYCVLKDIYKTTEYEIAKWRNTQSEVIPEYTMSRPPSGETLIGHNDQDRLPPYDILDAILFKMVEEHLSVEEIVSHGFEHDLVIQVRDMLFSAEYKRRQSAPGVKISSMSFGLDRRYPITNAWYAGEIDLI